MLLSTPKVYKATRGMRLISLLEDRVAGAPDALFYAVWNQVPRRFERGVNFDCASFRRTLRGVKSC